MSSLKTIYSELPIVLQRIACNLEGWRIRQLGRGSLMLGKAGVNYLERLKRREDKLGYVEFLGVHVNSRGRKQCLH